MTAVAEHEWRRLAELHEYRLLDAPADEELEAVVRVAASVAGVPTAVLNLIDENRQCQLTTVGFERHDSARSESMCAIHFETGRFVHITDATQNPVYASNPWVTGVFGNIRFYASAPLITPSGYALGTLCVFDMVPRQLSAGQIDRLMDLARVIVALFERRRQARIHGELAAEAEERKRFIDTVLETIDVGVVAVDRSGRLRLLNRASREWHGTDADPNVEPKDFARRYSLYETDGTSLLPSDRVPVLRVLREGAIRDAELVIHPHGKPAVHVTASGHALTARDGSVSGAVVAMTDITADRAQRQALRHAHAELAEHERQLAATVAELRRSNTELERFAGVVSHDLMSPLGVVNGYLELLADLSGEDLAEPGETWVTAARNAVARMQRLIQSLLNYAQAGNEPRRQRTNLGEPVDQALTDLRPQIEAVRADVTVLAEMPTACCDPVLVRQLLQNLISNAVKYRHPARPCRVAVTAVREAGGCHVAVADNGVGIPAEQRDRVFEMFVRADTANHTGYGIGLSTCQRIVQRHGGRIWLEDTPGGGTTVHFTLPDQAP